MAKVIEFYVPKNFGRPLKWAGGCQIRVQYLAERETEGSSAPCPAASTIKRCSYFVTDPQAKSPN
jgi:hypothetical protein